MPRLIRSAILTDYVEVARSFGLDPYRLLKEARLDRSCFLDPDIKSRRRVPLVAGGLGERGAGRGFGLRMSEARAFPTSARSPWRCGMRPPCAKRSKPRSATCACTPKVYPARLIVSDSTMAALGATAGASRPLGKVAVRGYTEPVPIWGLD
jgi:hypothetical protein